MQAGPGGPALRTAAEELDAVMRDGKPVQASVKLEQRK